MTAALARMIAKHFGFPADLITCLAGRTFLLALAVSVTEFLTGVQADGFVSFQTLYDMIWRKTGQRTRT